MAGLASPDSARDRRDAAGARRRFRGRRPSLLSATVALVGVVVTTGFAVTVDIVNGHNEDRLLQLQTRQTATLLQAFVQSLETPLASAAEIASSGGGASVSYQRYAASFLRTQARFVSVTLWRVEGGAATLVSTVGTAPRLVTAAASSSAFLLAATRSAKVGVIADLAGTDPRLGYSYASAAPGTRYVVYAEDRVAPPYRAQTSKTSPFADLRYALYFGMRQDRAHLLATSERSLPLRGRTAHTVIAFGTASLTLVASPVAPLGGTLAGSLAWVIPVLGLLITLAAAFATDRLVKRRRSAEAQAIQIDRLLGEQRTISETLQRALLPERLPDTAGIEVASRYLPGVNGIEIGGDWYDVIAVDDEHLFFAVGDVSGRGLAAGSIMASLHYAIRAFVSEGHDAPTVLRRLGRILQVTQHKHFATVLCGYVDIPRRQVTVANAGHLPPLLVGGGEPNRFVPTDVGPPIGVAAGSAYAPMSFTMPPGSVLLLYTDGLVERRGESLDAGLERLRGTATAPDAELDAFLGEVIARLTADDSQDDTALLALRWIEEPR